MAVDLAGGVDGQRPVMTLSRGPAPDRPEEDEVFIPDRLELVTAALPPGSVRQRLGKADDVTWPPTETTAQPHHHQPEPGSLALSDPR
jgi:hypothetical protein